MPIPGPLRWALVASLALALVGCKSKAEKDAEKALAAAETFCAGVPAVEPREFVRTSLGYVDTLNALEATSRTMPPPPPGTPAAARLAPCTRWIAAARAEHDALEKSFQAAIGTVEGEAHAALSKAVFGDATKDAADMAEALAPYRGRPIALWHGAGTRRGFDEDQQNLPAGRRAVDPAEKFLVGYVQRVDGEGVAYVTEKITAERKVAIVALFEVPTRRRLGVFTVRGETARLPTPVPLAGTTIPGPKPPLVENLLRAP